MMSASAMNSVQMPNFRDHSLKSAKTGRDAHARAAEAAELRLSQS